MADIANETNTENEETTQSELDSKYRLIIVAAKRSKQLQHGAKPRVEIEGQKHKNTRIALDEVKSGKIPFKIIREE